MNFKEITHNIVSFDKRSNVELHNRESSVGLCVIRPNRKEIELGNITKNNITVFYPFIKHSGEHDEPEAVALEYLYMKDQNITIKK